MLQKAKTIGSDVGSLEFQFAITLVLILCIDDFLAVRRMRPHQKRRVWLYQTRGCGHTKLQGVAAPKTQGVAIPKARGVAVPKRGVAVPTPNEKSTSKIELHLDQNWPS